jgi:hypothetical protein
MRQLLIVTLLGLSFVIGFTAIAVTIWPHISAQPEQTALLKEVP